MKSLRVLCVIPLLLCAVAGFGANITGTLYFTTYGGGNNVHSVNYTYNPGTSFTLSAITDLTPTPGADGILFDPLNGNLVVAGQSSGFVSEESRTGGPVTNVSVGSAGQSYHLALTANNSSVWNMPNGGSSFISVVGLPFGTAGTSYAVTGSDTDIRGVIFDPVTSQYYYTTAPDGGQGNFGSIVFNGSTFVTTRIASGLWAHGISYDPFSKDLIVNSGNFIQQINAAGNVLGTIQGIGNFDQAAEDGKGLLFVASNSGYLEFADYAATGNIGSATFVTEPYLANTLDDIAPLSGQGAPTPEPGTLLLLGTSAAGVAGMLRRKLKA
jgi:hypothetical protein